MPNNIVLLVTINKFDPNPILVNINKLKPCKFIEDRTLQPVLTKPSDHHTNELVQIEELEPLPIEPTNFQPTEFKSINNHLTHGSIKGTYVHVHYYYHDVHVEDNNATVCNDQNNTFDEVLIEVHILEVYNPKGHIYSQPCGRY